MDRTVQCTVIGSEMQAVTVSASDFFKNSSLASNELSFRLLQMHQPLLPLLLLSIIAVCSTNELPFLNRLELEKIFEEQDNDNTDKIENIEEIMFKQQLTKPIKSKIYEEEKYLDNLNEYNDYRKELEPRNSNSIDQFRTRKNEGHHRPKEIKKRDTTRDYIKKIKLIEDSLKKYEEVVTISPLLILKIRLSYLTDNIENMKPTMYHYSMPVPLDIMTQTKDGELNKILQDEISYSNDVRSDDDDEVIEEESKSNKNKKVVKKRIFSLWSRLQGLHRGHELHHRRHLHAFYGLPDDGGGGGDSTLTAETRATFLRPPGSPLRWG
ncbi:unnamed protein product [Pieris brassicae]|uniref:Uncharacterized protein n=1 Tax=Pieris brassicae TaxID=7116 RepID=A0A9P0T5A8_PIEBR|nr:unnamed protein product [Pieris brassicae]